MVSNIWALHEMAKTFRRDEGDRLLFPMHAVRLLCLAQKDRASDDAKAWMKGLDGQGRWDEIKPTIPDYAYDKHTSQGQAMVGKIGMLFKSVCRMVTISVHLVPGFADQWLTDNNALLQGRGDRHFLTEATKLIPESPDRDRTYLDRILVSIPEEDGYITRDGQRLDDKGGK